jgi:hypothetical protein
MTIKRMPAPQGFVAEAPAAPSTTAARTRRQRLHALNAADGTHQLLISGFWTMLVGILSGLLTVFVFGGMGRQGAHSNPGWLSLMVAMMSTPFAIMLLLLGGAKWLRNLNLSKDKPPR